MKKITLKTIYERIMGMSDFETLKLFMNDMDNFKSFNSICEQAFEDKNIAKDFITLSIMVNETSNIYAIDLISSKKFYELEKKYDKEIKKYEKSANTQLIKSKVICHYIFDMEEDELN